MKFNVPEEEAEGKGYIVQVCIIHNLCRKLQWKILFPAIMEKWELDLPCDLNNDKMNENM